MAAGVGWTSLHLYNYPVNARFLKDITDYVLVHRIVGCCRNWIDILAYTLIYIHMLKHLKLYILASILDKGVNLNPILQLLQELNCNPCIFSYFPNAAEVGLTSLCTYICAQSFRNWTEIFELIYLSKECRSWIDIPAQIYICKNWNAAELRLTFLHIHIVCYELQEFDWQKLVRYPCVHTYVHTVLEIEQKSLNLFTYLRNAGVELTFLQYIYL